MQQDVFQYVSDALSNELQSVQFMFLRLIAGKLRKSTSRHLLLREFGCHPLIRKWFVSMLSFWNRVAADYTEDRIALSSGGLLRCVMRENWELSQQPVSTHHSSLWCTQFKAFLAVMQQSFYVQHIPSPDIQLKQQYVSTALVAVQHFQQVNIPQLIQCFDTWFSQKWFGVHVNPRLAPSCSVTWSTYDRWFAAAPFTDLWKSHPSKSRSNVVCDAAGLHTSVVGSLLRFRLAAHDLHVCVGRWHLRDRTLRVCNRCSSQHVEDEFHMIFECPLYTDLRQRYHPLFANFGGWRDCSLVAQPSSDHMRSFMQQPSALVAAFVHACWLRRCGQETNISVLVDDSDDFFSVASDEWFDCDDSVSHTPMSDLLAPTGCPNLGA